MLRQVSSFISGLRPRPSSVGPSPSQLHRWLAPWPSLVIPQTVRCRRGIIQCPCGCGHHAAGSELTGPSGSHCCRASPLSLGMSTAQQPSLLICYCLGHPRRSQHRAGFVVPRSCCSCAVGRLLHVAQGQERVPSLCSNHGQCCLCWGDGESQGSLQTTQRHTPQSYADPLPSRSANPTTGLGSGVIFG